MIDFGEQAELIVLFVFLYVTAVMILVKIGSLRSCGALKAFLISFFLTPVAGVFYTLSSPSKSILKTVHYRCRHCGLEYTSSHRYCHICAKEGHKYRLHKISMKTY